MKKYIFLSCLIISGYIINAQCMMVPIELAQKVSNSSHIIEGKVIDQVSFWNPSHSNIFTSNLIEVYKTFKNTSSTFVEVVTEGGTVGYRKELVQPSLELSVGDIGVFTLNQKNLPSQFGKAVFEAYAGPQGFIKYDIAENIANEPFKQYNNISVSFYDQIELQTSKSYTVVSPVQVFVNYTASSTRLAAPVITSFSPTTITAGTFSELTINGSGFGDTRGTSSVEFRKADDGGNTFLRPDPLAYMSWSDTQIKLKLTTVIAGNSSATPGTGVIRVAVDGLRATSASVLTIPHAEINVYSSGNPPATIYNTRNTGAQKGGYVWQMFTDFDSNAAAKSSFIRAFKSWRCGTFINWDLGLPTTKNAATFDGVNVIRFDVGSELPANVLARCTNYFDGCSPQPNETWYADELDIVFDDATTWNFSTTNPTNAQFDFESVVLHELGHGHQLAHVNGSSAVMFYFVDKGRTKRALSANDITGANSVMDRSIIGICKIPAMIPLTSGSCDVSIPTASFTTNSRLICEGQSVVFTDISTGSPLKSNWIFAGGTPSVSVVSSPTVTYNSSGTFSVQLVSQNGYGSNTFLETNSITVDICNSINSISKLNELSIFPNPSNGVFTITGNVNSFDMFVLNTLGQTVKKEVKKTSGEHVIDLTSLSKGVYFLKIMNEDGSKLFKLIYE